MAEHDAAPEDELSEADPTAADAEHADVEDVDAEDFDAEVDAATGEKGMSPFRTATLVGLVIVAVAASLVGYLGFRTYHSQVAQDRDHLFVEVARQGAGESHHHRLAGG